MKKLLILYKAKNGCFLIKIIVHQIKARVRMGQEVWSQRFLRTYRSSSRGAGSPQMPATGGLLEGYFDGKIYCAGKTLRAVRWSGCCRWTCKCGGESFWRSCSKRSWNQLLGICQYFVGGASYSPTMLEATAKSEFAVLPKLLTFFPDRIGAASADLTELHSQMSSRKSQKIYNVLRVVMRWTYQPFITN